MEPDGIDKENREGETMGKDFFKYLINIGKTDEEARAIMGRHNAFKETKEDRELIKQYFAYTRQREAGQDREA